MDNREKTGLHFIKAIIEDDIRTNKHNGRVVTRFPPEPNGYLHIGHAKAICLDFGLALEYGGRCNLRFDDTNPLKEETEYVDNIINDIKWLGFDWDDRLYYASDYFDQLYGYAVELIKRGRAFVCNLTYDQIKEYRGTLKEPGKESPYRNRSIKENLELIERMKNGEFDEGECVLRAKIDMSSPNLNMRDPVIYRIRKASHHRTGDKWCIYPMYDYTHPLSDSIEGITHSLCTLEFEDHRPFYDWVLDVLELESHPQQIEFARLNLTYTIMSKRKLLDLVSKGYVRGWDDPRMPTIAGLRRRGFTPEAIRKFCDIIGVAKKESVVDYALLEHCLREDLNKHAPRVMAVLDPLKVVIENYPEDKTEWLEADNNPEDPCMGKRQIMFSKTIYIEREDFMEDPPKGYHRLSPGKEIRLKNAYYIRCTGVKKDPYTGKILELRCVYDPLSRGGWTEDGRKVMGTSHWVCEKFHNEIEVRLYENLFLKPNPLDIEEGGHFTDNINPDSLKIIKGCKIEKTLASANPYEKYQFLRQGYFCVDPDSEDSKLVFNKIVALKDSFSKKLRK